MIAEYYPITGIEDAYIAFDIQDSASAYSAGTPIQTPPAQNANWTSTQESQPIYGFNVKQDEVFGNEENAVVLRLVGISEDLDAKLRGKHIIAATGRIAGHGNPTPPLCALGLKISKASGEYTYVWFLKGRFSGGNIVAETKSQNVTINTREYTFTAFETEKKFTYLDDISGQMVTTGLVYHKGETAKPSFDPAGWFAQVQTPDTASLPSALSLVSSVPADDATGVAVDASIALTFNNTIASSALTLLGPSGAVVAVTKALNAAKTVLTVTPTAPLTAATAYTLVLAHVADVYGQSISDTVITFTTA